MYELSKRAANKQPNSADMAKSPQQMRIKRLFGSPSVRFAVHGAARWRKFARSMDEIFFELQLSLFVRLLCTHLKANKH